VIAADFEEGAGGASPGLNHPITGTIAIATGVWYHAAVTYDGTALQLYVNGVADGSPLVVGQPPRADSIQHAALGTALNSTGLASGFFAGQLDETRIWNYARTAAQMAAGANREIPTGNGLLARWSFNECCGRVVDSTGRLPFGALVGTGWSWVPRGLPALSTGINLAPTVDAGADHMVTLPALSTLGGVVSDDTVDTGTPLAIQWSTTSGPGAVSFGDPSAASTSVTFSTTGTYVLMLTASDGELSSSDSVTITVDGVVNAAPTVEAGADQTIALPTAVAALSGVVTDDGLSGTAVTTTWSEVSGPGTVTFADAAALATSATFSAEGTYVLELRAHDGLVAGVDTLSVVVTADPANSALRLGGTNAYGTFGAAPQLGAAEFTLEAWIRRDGTGIATLTGSGGITAVPLITKGMAEVDDVNTRDMNYFLGITPATGKLAADFEDTATGGNHPINGTAAIPADGSWHHVAATYDGTTWQLYVDGALDATLTVGAFTPRFDSIQHAALGTALNSTGGVGTQTQGFFNGAMDEVRIWNYARSAAQILSGRTREIPTASGLLGRWGLNEGAGTSAASSVGVATATIVGTNYSWVSGAPLPGALNTAPVVEAGADQVVTLPAVGLLVGSATDDGLTGTPVTSEWSQVSGPGVALFGAATAAVTTVDFTALGTYVLQLRASDGELAASDRVTVAVDGVVNQAPVVQAGGDQTITLPVHVAVLSGTATDDGLPTGAGLTTTWSKVSGPGTVTFANAAAAATTATFSMQGAYVLRLTASDGMLPGSDTVSVTVAADPANKALQVGGTNAFVALGPAPGLGAARFTLETWFRRDGAGVATSSGAGGVVAIPLITKGMAEVDDVNPRDMNYFLGIRQSDSVLVADFEDTATAGNHPVAGLTPILAGPAWHHAAVTYDGTNWRLYLDGQLEREVLNVGATPRFDSLQHAALGTALNSTGTSGTQTQGFFNGVLDEARIWNYARSADQISRGRRLEIAAATPGLLGRWGLNEGTGTSAGNSAGGVTGTVVGSAWSWVEGAPFTGVNQTPAAVDDTATTAEEAAVTVAVLGNDSDGDGDPLTIVGVGSPANGTAIANADGTVTYTPAGNFSGANSFSYTVSDGLGGSATALVHVTVTAVNDAPVAADDAATTSEDTPVALAVLGNDVDGDSSALTPIVVSGPARGSLTIAAGSITYTPAADFNGIDRFTYTANDGTADSNVATVTITVESVNDVPAVVSDSYSLDEDGMLHVGDTGVLSNDSDADGDSLSATLVSGPAHGGLMLNAEGSFIYTPDPDYSGADSFTYRVNDGAVDSAEATVALTITPVNDVPVAAADSYSTDEDTVLGVAAAGVLANDSDLDADTLQAVVVSGPSHGTLALLANGSFTYTPASNYNGPDSFTYKVNDGSADSGAVDVAIVINPVNDAPSAAGDSFSIGEDTALNVGAPGVLANDSEVEGASMTAVLVSGTSHGSLTLNPDGSFIYAPEADFHGSDSFSYRASDGEESSSVVSVAIAVDAVNDRPMAVDDTFNTNEDTALSAAAPGVLANDSDEDGDSLTAILVSGPSHGALTLNANGSFSYTPAANYSGTDAFTYKVSDGSVDSDVLTVTIALAAVNDVPVSADNQLSTDEDVSLVLAAPGVMGNDTDADADPLAAALMSGPSHGTLALNGDGSLSYTPAENYNGSDSFTYRVSDGTSESNVATVVITIGAVPDVPTALDNNYSKTGDGALIVTAPGVLVNDQDADGDPLTAVLVSGPSHGTLTFGADGSFSYSSAAGYSGADSFTYQAHDGTAGSNVATVSIAVDAVNDRPVAAADSYSTDEDTPLTVGAPGILANDSDVDSTTLTAVRVAGPAHGTLILNADGSFTYTPKANYSGVDKFNYRARDEARNSNVVSVTIIVNATNDAPVAQTQAKPVREDGVSALMLRASDVEGSVLTFAVVTPPAHGKLTGTLPSLTYDPDPNYFGPDSFTFTANDGELDSSIATVRLNVTARNDPPQAIGADLNTGIGTPVRGQLEATDIEDDSLMYQITVRPSKGVVTLDPATGAFTYTPFPWKTGADHFRFKANDGIADSNPARIHLQIR
jgi:VCBS repeat-containing protein